MSLSQKATSTSSIEWIQLNYLSEKKFYNSFHKNNINWRIHAVSIPLEWLSWLIFLRSLGGFGLYVVMFITMFTAVYFLALKSKLSVAASFFQLLCIIIVEVICIKLTWSTAMLLAGTAQVLSWIAQILVGHKLFEKNDPAMATKLTLNSIILSCLLAWDYG
jgi:uncharacterized membrane protein YGL010W